MNACHRPWAHVLLVGDASRPQVAELIGFLQSRTRLTVLSDLADLASLDVVAANGDRSAIASTSAEPAAIDLIVLAPALPSEYSAEQVERLVDLWPIAMRVVLVDSWLEGETRSGRPWPGVARLYWDQFLPQWELAEREDSPNLGIRWRPPTWTADEGILLRVDVGHKNPPEAKLMARQRTRERQESRVPHALVCAETSENRRTLLEVCQQSGWRADGISPPTQDGVAEDWQDGLLPESPLVVLYDASPQLDRRERHIQWLRNRWPETALILLVDFPRHEEVARAERWGVFRVLGKPYRLEDLLISMTVAVEQGRGSY